MDYEPIEGYHHRKKACSLYNGIRATVATIIAILVFILAVLEIYNRLKSEVKTMKDEVFGEEKYLLEMLVSVVSRNQTSRNYDLPGHLYLPGHLDLSGHPKLKPLFQIGAVHATSQLIPLAASVCKLVKGEITAEEVRQSGYFIAELAHRAELSHFVLLLERPRFLLRHSHALGHNSRYLCELNQVLAQRLASHIYLLPAGNLDDTIVDLIRMYGLFGRCVPKHHECLLSEDQLNTLAKVLRVYIQSKIKRPSCNL